MKKLIGAVTAAGALGALAFAPAAHADPPDMPGCSDPDGGFTTAIGTVADPETNSYSLCTNTGAPGGWVTVNEPLKLDPRGSCNHGSYDAIGTVDPHGGEAYTICTNLGWVDVNRKACVDFPDQFDCAGNPKSWR